MSGHKLNLLSIDGGGIKGLSALYLLKKLMELIDFEDPPKPCEVFDMIGGTSTGGWIAIMLGRLDMTVDEYITSFLNLQRRIFQHDAPEDLLSEERLDDNAVEVGFKELIRERGLQPDCLLKDGTALCKVFVTATRAGPSTEMLSSYYRPRGSSELYQHTKIWQAARATSAASGFFGLIEIGPAKRRFADGGAGANNPVEKLWEEMEDLLGPGVSLQDNLNCIVSLGTVGSGKTLCSANTVHHLQQGAHGVQEVYHFLFDQSATGARDAVAAVNALIKQILDRHSHQARQLCSIINTYYGPGTEQSTLEEICENVFLPLICSLASPVLLIDGLDLCDTVSLPDLVRVLLLSARNGAKVLIAARGREILAFKTRELSFIEIEISRRTPGVEEELHSVIGKAIALKRIRHSICSETMIDTITSHLLEKVGVMILWAALLLDEIWTDCIDDASITLYLLEHLPENLKATYLRCVERLSATRGSLSQRILVAVCASTEPFQMEELRDYLALREVDGALQTEPEHLDDTEEYVQPIHHSVIQHIIPETERTSAELETGKFCLLYLQASTAVVPLEKPKPRKSRMTVGVPGGLPTRALRLVSGRDVIVSPLYVPPRPPGLRGLGSKHGGSFLDYAQRAWVQSNRHIAPTDDLQWRLFSNMALDNSGTLDLPWPCERSSPFSQLTGLFLWAITHEHGPLLALALSEQERRSWPGTHQDLRRLAVSIDDQGSVQHFVAKQGRRKIFKILLHPAYLLDRDARGNTTLHVASLHGNQGILDEFYSYAEQRGVGHTQAWRNDFLSVQRNLPSLPQSQEKERWRLHVSWQSKARTDSVTGTQNDQMSFRFDILNDEGETPLHMAVLGGRLQSVITVYTKSLRCSVLACPVGHADVHTVEGLGWMRKSDNSGSLPIHHAVANGSIRLFKYCHTELHRLPDPTNSVPSTKTLLRHALRNTQWTMAMFMLKHHSSELEGWAVDICSTLRVWGPQGLIVFLWNTCYPTLVDHGCELEDDQATWSIQQFFADFDLFHHIHPHIYEIPSMLLLAAMTRQSHLLSCLAHMHPKAFLSSIISKDGVLRYFFWLPLYQRTRGSSYQSGKKHTVNDQNLFDSIVDHMQSQLRRQSGYRRNGLTDLLLASSHLHDRQSFYAAIVLTQRIPLGLFKELQNSGRGDDCNLLKNVAWSLDGDFVKRRIERHELWLWILATQGDEDAVHSFLSHHVIKIFDICCARGTSPIWQACMRGHITVAKLLLENGAYSNSKVRNTRPVPRHPDSNSQELEVPAGLTPDEVLARYHGMLDLFDTTRSTTTFGQRYHAVQVNQQPVELEATPFIPRVSWGTSNQLSWIKAQMLPAWPPL
ncbi:Hypothetical protein D9617_22g066970 [Elsinoe fawcettii]|nr:Hypothetical protein D9617_22g066970 [Elsinoe fawcettii]